MAKQRPNYGRVQNGRRRTNILNENDGKGVISSEPVVLKTGLPTGHGHRDDRVRNCY